MKSLTCLAFLSLNNIQVISIPPSWLQLSVVVFWLGMVILIAAWFHFQTNVKPETVRKVVHIGTGNIILWAWWLQIPAWIGIGVSIFFTILTLLSHRFFLLPGIESVGRKSWGTVFYAVSIGLLIAVFWSIERPEFAVLGILIMTWGDGMAALIGQQIGVNHYHVWGVQKSWEGSLTMTLVSWVVGGVVLGSIHGWTWQVNFTAFTVALVATVLESFSKFGIDNLTVPLASAGLGFVLVEWFGILGQSEVNHGETFIKNLLFLPYSF